MSRWLLGLLLIANIGFFAYMTWGELLTTDVELTLSQAELNPDKIRMLSDVRPAPTVMPASVPQAAIASAVVPSTPVLVVSPELVNLPKAQKQCLEWGEFSGSGLAQAKSVIAAMQLGDKVSQREVEHTSGFWVFIPPLKNHAQVQIKVKQLKKMGISDYFVVQEEGGWLHAISLGVFKTEDAAENFLATLRAKGVRSAKVGERMMKLKFTLFVLKNLDSTTEEKIRLAQKDLPESELKMADCN